MIGLLFIILFAVCFSIAQGVVYLSNGTTPVKEAKAKMDRFAKSNAATRFVRNKQIYLKKMGAGVLLKDQMSVSQWYIFKGMMAAIFGMLGSIIAIGMLSLDIGPLVTVAVTVLGWFILDIMLKLKNKSSNDAMMADIMEMSRSVLYGKRGGQYIADALRDAVIVVENKRLKSALMKLKNNLDSGMPLDECLDEFELSFSNAEITAFCTVIKSLQSTGQVDEALKTLERNIEREQISVNKKRCVMLEHKTMMYVIFIAMDIMVMILYCIIVKLLELTAAF